MRGIVQIERENTDGDRRIVQTIDVEGLSSQADPLKITRDAVRTELNEPGEFTVRAYHDNGWTRRLILCWTR